MASPIISLTETALARIREFQEQQDRLGMALRVGIQEDGPAAFRYQLRFVPVDSRDPTDRAFEHHGLQIYIGEEDAPNLQGCQLDYIDSIDGAGFSFENPNMPPLLRDPVAARVQDLIQERINPGLASHGGRVRLMDLRDGRVFLEFGGGCQGCGMVDQTLKQGIEATLMSEIPEIREVVDTTDHDSGADPYQPRS